MNWVVAPKAWSFVDVPVELPINKTRFSVTVFASISTSFKRGYAIDLKERTDYPGFLAHLQTIKYELRNPDIKPYIVLDGARAHHSLLAKDYLESNFIPLWLPPYSPQFQSIESLWWPIKSEVRKRLADH